jgi:hypothetical protein
MSVSPVIADYRCMYENQNRSAARSGPLTTGGRNRAIIYLTD